MDAVQERQLVLMEKMNRRLDAIQEGQKKLEEANATLRNENETLRTELERQQQLQKTQKSRRGRKSRVQSTVEVPNDLRKRFRFIYKKMVEKKMTTGYAVTEDPESDRNQDLFSRIKDLLKKEHGRENCPWTDLQMEAQHYRYFKTVKERDHRVQSGTNDKHKEICRRSRRLLSKLERRLSGFEKLKATMTLRDQKSCDDCLYVD
ncbi:uncharacterized protein [Montipora foliosa]